MNCLEGKVEHKEQKNHEYKAFSAPKFKELPLDDSNDTNNYDTQTQTQLNKE